MGAEMAMGYAPGPTLAVATLFIGLWVISVFCQGIRAGFEKAGMELSLRLFLMSMISVGLKVLLVISVASMIGIETASFIAVVTAAGLAIGLALQGSLANFAGGVLILVFRHCKVGDFIDAATVMGVVKQIEIFSTIPTTGDNKAII